MTRDDVIAELEQFKTTSNVINFHIEISRCV